MIMAMMMNYQGDDGGALTFTECGEDSRMGKIEPDQFWTSPELHHYAIIAASAMGTPGETTEGVTRTACLFCFYLF